MKNTALLVDLEISDGSVEKAAIVPHDKVTYPPAMGVTELALCCICQKFIQQSLTFC